MFLTAATASCGRGLSTLLYWLISPATLGAACILLGFGLIVAAGQRARYQREAAHLKEEWMRYRKEMQAKVRGLGWTREQCDAHRLYCARNVSPLKAPSTRHRASISIHNPARCSWAAVTHSGRGPYAIIW